MITTINECNKSNYPLHLYFINFSKAFDLVEHWVIKSILSKLRLDHLTEVIMDLLQGSYTKLKINNTIQENIISLERGTK